MSTSQHHHSFALLRSPLLPVDQLIAKWELANDSAESLLFDCLSKPLVGKALYIASRSLHEVWQDWRRGVIARPPMAAQLALWRYVIRMSSRCTPFGLFAGVSTIRLAERTCTALKNDEVTAFIHPDMGWLTSLITAIEQHPVIRWQLRYKLNNSLYKLGSQYRYSDYTINNRQRAFFINSVEQDSLPDALLAHLKDRTKGITGVDLIDLVQQELGESTQEATEYVDELINAHLLVSELEAGVTGKAALDNLLRKLQDIPATESLVCQLETLQRLVSKPDLSVFELTQIHQSMRAMLGEGCPPGDVLQTDMVRLADTVTVSELVVRQLGEQLSQLMPLRADHKSADMSTFANRFYARYGGQLQPLLVALDHESGIGYGLNSPLDGTVQSSLLQQLKAQVRQPQQPTGDRLDTLRLSLLTKYLQTGQQELVLTDADLRATATGPTAPPARSWAALGELYGPDTETIDNGGYRFLLKSATGPSGVSLMARFCSIDGSLNREVQRITDWEAIQQPDKMLAELVHLPAGRIGNVVCRPTLRAFEIPYLTPSSVDDDYALPLSDLWVSVPDGKTVELWSKKHGKQVLPRNTTAHNYRGSDEVYRFLSDLSHQEESLSLHWSWGMLADQPALPRVTYRRIILARAQWTITKKEHWISADRMMKDLDQTMVIVRYVALVEADNELLLDLNTRLCQDMLFAELDKRKTVRVVEWLATPGNCWLTQCGHRFASELIIPFHSVAPPLPSRQSPFRLATHTTVQRTFLPGSDWLYVKVYAGIQTADELLKNVVGPFVEKAAAEGLISHWFFIRYYDPNPHLRLRFHCEGKNDNGLMTRLMKEVAPWVEAGRVHTIQLDTYERELERYGTRTIELCEQLFWQDSEWNLQWLVVRDEFDEDQQWWIACHRADQLFDAFGLSLDEKSKLINSLQARFLIENGTNSDLRKELNEHYRSWKIRLTGQEESVCERVAEWSFSIPPLVKQLREMITDYPLEGPYETELLSSLLHMVYNRFFTSGQRLSEGVVYHFLARHYRSKKARQDTQKQLTSAQFAEHKRPFTD